MCLRCGEQDDNTLNGRCYCERCSESHRNYMKERRKTAKENKCCIYCMKQDDRTLQGNTACTICNDKNKISKLSAKERAISTFRCTRCKKQDAYTLIGKHYCADCMAKNAEQHRQSRSKNPQKFAQQQKEIRERRLNNRKCLRCGRDLPSGYNKKTCDICLSSRIIKNRDKRVKEGVNYPRGGNGYCWQCNKNKAVEGKKLCETCLSDKMRAIKSAQAQNVRQRDLVSMYIARKEGDSN